MSAQQLNDLLPIPNGITDPHAYQVFGLAGGEQDPAKIKKAVSAVYAKLKAAKQAADPAVWMQAAKLAEKSKAILLDPQKRAELDARFGVVNVPPPEAPAAPPIGVAPTATPPANDPLAGMLPPTNPMAAPVNPMAAPVNPMAAPVVPAAAPVNPAAVPPNPLAPSQPTVPTPTVPTPVAPAPVTTPQQPYAQAGPTAPAAAATVSALPKTPKLKVKKSKRRKKSGAGKLFFIVGLCGLAAASAALGVFVYLGEGIPITKDGKIVAQRASDREGPSAAPARPVPPRDPVMGSMADGMSSPPKSPSQNVGPMTATGLPANQFSKTKASPDASSQMGMQSEPSMPDNPDGDMSTGDMSGRPDLDSVPTTDSASTAEMSTGQPAPAVVETEMPAMNPDGALPVSSGKETGPIQLTDEQIAANDAEIKKIKDLIRSRSWEQMKPAVVAVSEKTLSSSQAIEAETLLNLVDLALHYRGGVQRGLESLKSTQTFEVTEGFRVSVVEATPNSLSVKANGRTYRYGSIEEIKFRLGEKIASFAMDPEKPDTIAARAIYQVMSPLSNPEHVADSVQQLEEMDAQMPDVDTKAITKLLTELF